MRTGLGSAIREDFAAWSERTEKPLPWWKLIGLPLQPSLVVVLNFRISQRLAAMHLGPLARVFYVLNMYFLGCEMRPEVKIGPGLFIPHPIGVIVGAGTIIGRNAVLGPRAGLGAPDDRGWPVLGDNVTMFTNSSVLGGVRVGDDVVVGAHAMVIDDVPSGTIVAGVPARVLRQLTTDEIMSRRRRADRPPGAPTARIAEQ